MNRLGLIVAAGAVLLLIFGVVQRRGDPFDVDRLIAEPSASREWTETARQALERVTVNTRFAAKWQIGEKPRDGRLTLVLIDAERMKEAPLVRGLAGNCTYTGAQALIICDVALVRNFLASRDLDKRVVSSFDEDGYVTGKRLEPLDAKALQANYRLMLEWILGHEIGHILNNDRRTHFTSDRLEDPVAPASIGQEKELNADAFLARQYHDDDGADWGFYLFLIGILQNEINRKACPDRSPILDCPNIQTGVLIFSPNDYVRYSRKGTHPEFIIRVDRLLILADEQHDLGIVGPLARGLKQKLLEEGAPRPS